MAVVHYPGLNRPEHPLCSVCIANFNGIEVLGDCIESVLSQQGGGLIEIIIHDDASSDGSVEWIRACYPQVVIIASDANVGFCVANNRMLAQARGEFLLLLNNDAALHPDAIATLVEEAGNPTACGILTLPQFDWQSGQLVDRGCLLDPFYNPVPNLDAERVDVAMVIGACMFLPRALWGALGGFPEWFGSIAEDMYLCCAARLRGLPVRVTTRSGYRHRQGASFGGNRPNAGRLQTTFRRRALSERNKTAVLVTCTPGWLAWPLLALHCVLLLSEGVILAVLKRDAQLWREVYRAAVVNCLKHRAELREARRVVQGRRIIGTREYFRPFHSVPRKLVLLVRHGLPELR